MGVNIRKGLAIILIMMLSYLVIANLLHMIALRQTQTISLASDSSIVRVARRDFETLTDHLATLKTMERTNHIPALEFQKIITTLEEAHHQFKQMDLMNWNFSKQYRDIDLMKLIEQSGNIHSLGLISAYDTIIKYDPGCGFDRDQVIADYTTIIFTLGILQNSVIDNYQYRGMPHNFMTAVGADIVALYGNTSDKLKLFNDVATYLIKDGGANA